MRVWYSGSMRPSQGWDASPILATRTRVNIDEFYGYDILILLEIIS